MPAGWVQRTPREFHRTSQEGLWLFEEWKSNASQQGMRAEFIEDREQTQMECPGDSKREGGSLVFVQDLGVFVEDGGLVYVSPEASRNQLEQKQGPRCYSFDPGVLGSETSSADGLEYTCPVILTWSSLNSTYSREILNSLSLRRRIYAIYIMRHV